MTANEYRVAREELMRRWSEECWEWLGYEKDDPKRPVFYMDGAFDSEEWYRGLFRPLFILKEVNEETDGEATDRRYDFIGDNRESDPWLRVNMWKKFSVLLQAVLAFGEGRLDDRDYQKCEDTTMEEHQDALKKVAVINLKKIGGGSAAAGDKSKQTFCFECHASRFSSRIKEQIELLQPSVIICCGKNSVINSLGITQDAFFIVKDKEGHERKVPVINGYHPSRNSYEKLCGETLKGLEIRGKHLCSIRCACFST